MPTPESTPTRSTLANAIRALAMDAVQRANSGHPGMPMGMADIAEVLWNDFLKHNPNNPNWDNRDRFILSNGHGSMLLYSLLHLTGYDMSIDDLKNFRQLHSKTPGHPEYGCAPGIETTTGPLGQGICNAVGMALAERTLAAEFNRPAFPIVDHYTYCFVGDGCLMEGISHEACSLAGTLGLGKLIALYDDNGISIDGKLSTWFSDDTPARFRAYDWHVVADVDGHDPEALKKAIAAAQAITDKPSLICCKTHIAHGSPNLADSHKSHGAPLGDDEINATRENIEWDHEPFVIPDEIYKAWDAKEKGNEAESEWKSLFSNYKNKHADLAQEYQRRLQTQLPSNWSETILAMQKELQNNDKPLATRKASLNVLNTIGSILPELLGGSADLTGSNLTLHKDSRVIDREHAAGNYLHYGVREFGMSAMMNGLALHGGFIPYGGTFLVFMDYARNAVRLAALMKQRVIFIYSHDSIGLGEDGPTHQPIEHINTLRNTPNMSTWRPCDNMETLIAWQTAIEKTDAPTSLLLTRQSVPQQKRNDTQIENIKRGGYILKECEGTPDVILIATGSEVALAIEAHIILAKENINARVVSMPSCDTFEAQDEKYQNLVLPTSITARVAIEAGSTAYWYKYVGLQGKVIGIDTFGESAPAPEIYQALGVTTKALVDAVKTII